MVISSMSRCSMGWSHF